MSIIRETLGDEESPFLRSHGCNVSSCTGPKTLPLSVAKNTTLFADRPGILDFRKPGEILGVEKV